MAEPKAYEPEKLTSGVTWKWKKTISDYPASEWTLTYYLRKDLPSRVRGRHMSGWRKQLFFSMLRNAQGPADLLNLPPAQVIEVGIRLNF